jgi:homocitrate synthase
MLLFFVYKQDIFSGYCAFTHKAGIHAKAILNNPSTYEILKPEDFGLTRYVSIGCVQVK